MDSPSATPTPGDNRLPVLDGLGVAILLVMICHFFVLKSQNNLEAAVHNFAKLGMGGVDLFFVLSGFLITGILLRTKEQPHYFRNFYMRRLLRIMPLYYALVAFSFLAPVLALMIRQDISVRGSDSLNFLGDWSWYVLFASNFLFTVRGCYQHAILDVTWSLALEEQFYLLWPLLVLLVPPRTLRWVCGGLIVTATLVRVLAWLAGWNPVQVYVFPLGRMDGLALGALVAIFCRDGVSVSTAVRRVAVGAWLLSVGLLAALFIAGHSMDRPEFSSLAYYPLASVAATASLLLAISAPAHSLVGRLLSSRLLRFFGHYSYGLYLFHFPVRAIVADLFFGDAQVRQLPFSPWLGLFLFYAIATLAVIPLAMFSWRAIEAPCLRLKSWFGYKPADIRNPIRGDKGPNKLIDEQKLVGVQD